MNESPAREFFARRDVAILTPTPVDRGNLVIIRTHHLGIHAGHVYNLIADTEVEVGLQRPLTIAEVDAETTVKLRV